MTASAAWLADLERLCTLLQQLQRADNLARRDRYIAARQRKGAA